MKKLELADAASNMFVLFGVLVAATPFMLGDQLVPMVDSAMREGAMLLNEFSSFLATLLK